MSIINRPENFELIFEKAVQKHNYSYVQENIFLRKKKLTLYMSGHTADK